MTEVYRTGMSNKNNNGKSKDDDVDSPTKCRERRRRRIEMRRLAAISSSSGSSQPSEAQKGRENQTTSVPEEENSSSVSTEAKRKRMDEATAVVETVSEVQVVEPVFGSMSVSGRSREMEDAISVRTNLCRPEINRRRPVHVFGVFDGHGGPHVAALCRERMHVLLEEELMRVESTLSDESGDTISSGGGDGSRGGEEKWEAMWREVLKRSFDRMDEVALSTCACGSVGCHCGCHPMQVALGGSTAVVAVLTQEHVIVANCGDSRAVLCRGRRGIPLSLDHKPDRSDELARIEAAGGRVIFLDGARVEGILAMSRAIGDKYLKPIVISEPEITFTKRESEDECLILASDGLWDVLSSDLACEVARECLREGNPPPNGNAGPHIEVEDAGALYPSRSVLAAALLTRLALGRRSSDNISVIVIDLKRS